MSFQRNRKEIKLNSLSEFSVMTYKPYNLMHVVQHGFHFRNIPSWKQKFGGKSLPQEKFSILKAERFLKQGYLVLPAIEVVYVWNGFNIIGKSHKLTEDILGLVKKEKKKVEARKGTDIRLLTPNTCFYCSYF